MFLLYPLVQFPLDTVLIHADARAIPLKDESVNCCVTSPPYWGLRDYGAAGQIGLEPTPELYVATMVDVFREVRRVLNADGTLWLNLGDSYCSVPGGGQQGKNGQMADRAVVRARAQVRDGKAAAGMGAPQRPPSVEGLKPKDLVGIPWRVAFALQSDGWWLRSDIIWAKPNPMPESVTDRPTKSHEYLFLLAKSERYYYDADAIAERSTHAGKVVTLGEKSLSRGQAAGANVAASGNGTASSVTVTETRNARSVWTIPTTPYPGAHFATFPPALARRCILAGCPPGGIVLDPFVGSGTTVMVARQLGREGIGVDINPKYLDEQAEKRIKTDRGFAFPA